MFYRMIWELFVFCLVSLVCAVGLLSLTEFGHFSHLSAHFAL